MPIISLPVIECGEFFLETSEKFIDSLKQLLEAEIEMFNEQAPEDYPRIAWARLTVHDLGDMFPFQIETGISIDDCPHPEDGGGQFAIILNGASFSLDDPDPKQAFNLEDVIREIVNLNLTIADLENAAEAAKKSIYNARLALFNGFFKEANIEDVNQWLFDLMIDYHISAMPDDLELKVLMATLDEIESNLRERRAELANAMMIKEYLEKRREYLRS